MRLVGPRTRSAVKTLLEQAQRLDVSRLALPSGTHDAAPFGFVAVYRAKHSALLHRVVRQLGPHASVRLWALDQVPDSLAELTVGRGPGTRFALLNRLIAGLPETALEGGLVVSDDDYVFRVGTLPQLLAVGRRAGLDVWQPAHARNSYVSYPFVRRRRGTVLRRTTFVEQGPLIVLSASAQRVLLPLPEDRGMAWGAEIAWSQAAVGGVLNLGIVDAIAVHHLAPLGGYDREEQGAQLQVMLDEADVPTLQHLQVELSRIGVLDGRRALRG